VIPDYGRAIAIAIKNHESRIVNQDQNLHASRGYMHRHLLVLPIALLSTTSLLLRRERPTAPPWHKQHG
jgi:hypothetical protein